MMLPSNNSATPLLVLAFICFAIAGGLLIYIAH